MRFRSPHPADPDDLLLSEPLAPPATMRAQVLDRSGAAGAFRTAEVATPSPVLSEVLVRVVAAGVGPMDAETRLGRGVAAAIATYPATLGSDFSGVVAAAPFASHPFPVGTEVFGVAAFPRTAGTYAEYVVVPSLALTRKPGSLSHVEAAGVPTAALTAWGLVVETALAHEGQRILVLGGSGGVGHFAVQFASYFGARVTAVASPRERDWVRELGAETVIESSTAHADEDVDVVIDLLGDVAERGAALARLRPGGLLLATALSDPTPGTPTPRGVRFSGYEVIPDGATLATIARLLDSGAVQVYVDRVFDLEDAAAAHAEVEKGTARGALVLRVSDD